MLHRVRPPSCRADLQWVVNLQRLLLTALCEPDTTSDTVTGEWVTTILTSLSLGRDWITKFCAAKSKVGSQPRTLLEHMENIAGFSTERKAELLAAFDNDTRFQEAFGDSSVRPYPLRGISFLTDPNARLAVRGFLEGFYAPIFYSEGGYPIARDDGSVSVLNKDVFLREFRRANPHTRVCPLCDGQLGVTSVDHFYPKSYYPCLACHPFNLVPICTDCNKVGQKGDKIPLSKAAADPMEDWFHPYFQFLADWTERASHPPSSLFAVGFEYHRSAPDETSGLVGTVPTPWSSDPTVNKRLENLDQLVNLRKRWQVELENRMSSTIAQIQDRRAGMGRYLSRQELLDQLAELARTAKNDIGSLDSSILAHHYLSKAAQGTDRILLDELLVEGCGADVLTAQQLGDEQREITRESKDHCQRC